MSGDPTRLSISVTQSDGRVIQWNPDDVDGRNVPNDLSFSTSIPGGFQDMSCSLLRRIDQDYADLDPFDTVTVYGPGNRIAWQGRMQQFPRSHGQSTQITPGAVGWAAHLRDDPSFTEIYIDRDLSHWGPPPTIRHLNLGAYGTFDPQVQANTGAAGPVLATLVRGPWNAAAAPISEAWYDAGAGTRIGSLRANWERLNGNTNSADVNWIWAGALASDEGGTATASSGNLRAAGPSSFVLPGGSTSRYAFLQCYYAAVTAGTNNMEFGVWWSSLRVIGTHGLPPYGSGIDEGIRASDAVAHIVSNAAPLLTYTTGTDGSITPTTFNIPHLEFRDPTTAEDAIGRVNTHHLYDWGVYDNREFFYRQPDPDRLLWEARLGDGAAMEADGVTAEQVINGVFVTYTDGAGVLRTVGPPGGGFESEDGGLVDYSEDNPANQAGIPRKWAPLTLSFRSTQTQAATIGAAYLAERSLASRRGSVTLTGLVQHPTEGKVPVWRVRAGDWIRISDLNGENADIPRKVISTSYSHASGTISLSLDNTVAKLDAILARVGVQAGVTTGGGF